MEFIDLQAQYKHLKDEIDSEIAEVLSSSKYIIGPKVELLERELAEYVGRKYCISCSDGTSALQLIYMAYGIGVGDAVFCPDMTFIASIEPACLLGATPVFCDIDSVSYNLSSESLERQIHAVIDEGELKPKAIVAVDFVGNRVITLALPQNITKLTEKLTGKIYDVKDGKAEMVLPQSRASFFAAE